jgi:hypothetical protein
MIADSFQGMKGDIFRASRRIQKDGGNEFKSSLERRSNLIRLACNKSPSDEMASIVEGDEY